MPQPDPTPDPKPFASPSLDSNDGRIETPQVVAKPVDDDDADDETAFKEIDGKRYVRAEALAHKSGKLRERTAELKTAKEKAQKYDLVEPLLPYLATHPDLPGGKGRATKPVASRRDDDDDDERRPAPRGPRPAAVPEEDLAEFDGVLSSLGIDQEAGRKLVELTMHVADRRANRANAPIQSTLNRSIAQQARERMYKATDPNTGELFADRRAIDHVLSTIPESMLASEENITHLLIQARGLAGSGGRSEPLHTENTGSRGGRGTPKDQPITEFEDKLMKAHGMDKATYAKFSNQDTLILE